MKSLSFGYLPSPPDFRDISYDRLIGGVTHDLPETHILPTYPILDQDGINACVWYSFALDAMKRAEKEYGFTPIFNPIYGYVDRLEGHSESDNGVIIREALQVYQKRGIAEYSKFPWVGTYANLHPKILSGEINIEEARENAYIHRIGTYARLWSEAEINKALYDGYYVMIAYPVYKHFLFAYGVSVLPDIPRDKLGNYVLGHMSVQYGYQPYGRFIQNSWGELWGDKGRIVMPYSYPIFEAWAVTDIPVPSIEKLWDCIIKKDSKFAYVFGQIEEMPVKPEIKNKRMYIPLRFVSEKLGYKVNWTSHDEPITIVKNNKSISIKVGDYFFWRQDGTGGQMDAAPYLLDDNNGYMHTMVPIRFVAEVLGGEVHWSTTEQKVYIRK